MKKTDDLSVISPAFSRLTVRIAIILTAVSLPLLLLVLWRLGATSFQFFAIPIILAICAISAWMAVHWHEWRAVPFSVVAGMIVLWHGLGLAIRGGVLPATPSMELLSEMILWAVVPLGLASVAYLWRIFENQAGFIHAQKALESSEKKYRHLIENATDAFYVAEADGRISLLNTGGARIFGRRAADLVGTCLFDLVSEETCNDIKNALARQVKENVSAFYHEFPVTGRNGSITWVGENLQVLTEKGVMTGFQAVMRDITEKRRTEDALHRSEGRLLTLFETISEGIVQTDANGRVIFSNPAAERLLEASAEDLRDRNCTDARWSFLSPDGDPMPVEEWAGCKTHRTRAPAQNAVMGVARADGTIRWLRLNALPIYSENKEWTGVVATFADITENKDAEENIRIVEFALDNADEHVFMLTEEGNIVYANQRAISALGYSRDQMLSKTIHDIDPQVSAEDWATTWRAAKTGQWSTSESIHVTREGKSFPVITSSNYFEFKKQGYIFAFVRDISREANLASQLRQSQKIEAIGMLAGGIAHDFNNILSAIIGYTELAIGEASPEGRQRTFLAEVKKATDRAAGLVDQILTFSRSKEQAHHPISLSPVVKEAMKLLRGSLPSTIEMRNNIDPASSPVMSDPVQIHQVIMNLCTNAYHAMRDTGGILDVHLQDVEIGPEEALEYLNITPGTFVRLSVRDTGCGMDEETRRQIFEPFFTTKPEGEGTGLGLATVLGIVKGHKGAIRVESEPGKGTCVDLLLPICLSQKTRSPQHNESPPEKGKERVLFVDDEYQIANSTGIALEQLGYQAQIYHDAREALDCLLADPGRFDILITDYTMPGMTGIELARRAHEVAPRLPIILCTGLGHKIGDIEDAGISEILKKPLTIGVLTRKLRAVLDSVEPGPATERILRRNAV